jgi:hypothetical protein
MIGFLSGLPTGPLVTNGNPPWTVISAKAFLREPSCRSNAKTVISAAA